MMNAVMTQHEALVRLMTEHQHDVWRWLRYLGAEAALADDITQDVFIELYRSPIAEHSRAQTAAWLRKAAKHRYLNWLRDNRRQGALADDAGDAWAQMTPDSSDARVEALEKCMEALHERAAKAIDLKYRLDLTEHEVGAELATSAEAAKALLKRTREQLRECVERRLKP